MDFIERPISVARRRSIIQVWLDWTGHIGMYSLCLAACAILTAKLVDLRMDVRTWSLGWLVAAAIATILLPVFIAYFRRPNRLTIATQIDQRLNLRERLSSAVNLKPEERLSPMGAALWGDAQSKAESIDVRDSFPIKLRSHYLRWLAPILLIVCSSFLQGPTSSATQANPEQPLTLAQVTNSVEPLLQQIRQERKAAEDAELEEAELFKTLEAQLESLASQPPKDPSKVMSELNKMQEKLDEKRKELGTGESLKKQLADLKKLDDGPAKDFADAMKDGDMDEASDQVQKMLDKLQKGEMTKEEQEKLAEQLQAMKEALEEAVRAHEEQKKQLEEQIKQAKEQGNQEQANDLEKKLESLKQSDADMKAAKELSKSLSQCSECLSKGDPQSASKALGDMQKELSKMAKNAKQSQSLKKLSENMNDSKRSSQCKSCNGQGCSSCNSTSNNSQFSRNAKGEGKGSGPREEQKDDTSDFDSQVRGNVAEGETSFGARIAGDNKKTDTQFDTKEAIRSSSIEDPDPIEQAKLPKKERDVSKEYMNALRLGK